MLERNAIEDLIYARIPEQEVRKNLLGLTPDQITVETLESFVQTIKDTVDPNLKPIVDALGPTIDCSGTGGSGLARFNTSTTVAFVLAAAGLKVAKFGNRAASGRCGSFDFLGALGLPDTVAIEALPELMDECNLLFLFAPQFYPVLATLAQIRQTLGQKTIFNFIGPLLNPTAVTHRVMGVSNSEMLSTTAQYLQKVQAPEDCSLVVRSNDGLDELGDDRSDVCLVAKADLEHFSFTMPDPRNISPVCYSGCTGKIVEYDDAVELNAENNREIFLRLLKGEDNTSRFYRIVCGNAGAGLFTAGLAPTIEAGFEQSMELLRTGAVQDQFKKVRRAYAKYSE